ncbi:low temperature requirement protein A [Sinorhizobium numidicum]|uniref:Low temperature requirement protein A n=1 Tax=Sinorhizobium numidicum TaxID=680248 RepID=A0ABY8CWN5_9HYPH|nr:low temperature requirement protein A [Sinorhizobium numidicum]WEX76393.1 low temperature requirement protein A [Sinorhizobium numidicum]WEX83054.1 low temperature requirement protein A [Sinorhizobium numidicum]
MSETTQPKPQSGAHHLSRMSGRDPHEGHRAATPLELLFDLTFVIAFSLAAAQLAHLLAEGHFKAGLIGFGFASFAICWAWVNFSWFASAYDTDDWVFRCVTMVQMAGVLILAIGLPPMFESIDKGEHLNTAIMVLGYVVMRVAMVFQWLRAARQDPLRRKACTTYATAVSIAQVGWIILIFIDFSLLVTLAFVVVLTAVEMTGPVIAESLQGGTPWHAHHIAERYSLLAIIALGEGVVGTVASVTAVVEGHGWNLDVALVCIAGTGLTFGMWWIYFMLPSAEILHRFRERCFVWGYGHIPIFAAIVATGAGLHVAAYYIEHKAHISSVATVVTVALPAATYIALIYVMYAYLLRRADRLHIWLLAGTAFVLAASVAAAMAGIPMAVCLIILMLAPVVTIVGYEVAGHRHRARALEHALGEKQ